jgi:hypothetical protein
LLKGSEPGNSAAVVNRSQLSTLVTNFYRYRRRSPHWGPQTPAMTPSATSTLDFGTCIAPGAMPIPPRSE